LQGFEKPSVQVRIYGVSQKSPEVLKILDLFCLSRLRREIKTPN